MKEESMNRLRRRDTLVGVLGALALTAGHRHAWSQPLAWPNRPLRWLVASPPGGAADGIARVVAAQLSKQLGQPVQIENRAGGSGIIAAQAAISSPADGYTLLSANNGLLIYNVGLFRKLPYDPKKDLMPIGMVSRIPLLILSSKTSRFTRIEQMIDEARRAPGSISYASPGTGTPHHLAMEMLKHQARLDLVTVQYPGFSKAFQDMMAGQIELTVLDMASASAQVKAGNLRPLATFSRSRLASLPDVPTLMELGLVDIAPIAWQSLVTVANTPPEIQARLNAELRTALNDPGVRERYAQLGAEPAPSTIDEMRAFVDGGAGYWSDLVRKLNVTVD